MTGVDQTTFFTPETPRNGNCAEAAVATLLGIGLEEVPRFAAAGPESWDYWESFENFLTSKGYYVMRRDENYQPECIYLASGPSKRGCGHMVVMKQGELLWDPHPSREGIIRVDHVWLLVPRDPREFMLKPR